MDQEDRTDKSKISELRYCKPVCICVNIACLETILKRDHVEGRKPFLRVRWEGMKFAASKLSYIIITHEGEGYQSTFVNPDIARRLVNDNLILHTFARKMFIAYNIRLICAEYSPLVLTFQHCNGPQNNALTSDKKMLMDLLKDILTGEGNPKAKYRISIKTGLMDNEYNPCHCFELPDGVNVSPKEKCKQKEQVYVLDEDKLEGLKILECEHKYPVIIKETGVLPTTDDNDDTMACLVHGGQSQFIPLLETDKKIDRNMCCPEHDKGGNTTEALLSVSIREATRDDDLHNDAVCHTCLYHGYVSSHCRNQCKTVCQSNSEKTEKMAVVPTDIFYREQLTTHKHLTGSSSYEPVESLPTDGGHSVFSYDAFNKIHTSQLNFSPQQVQQFHTSEGLRNIEHLKKENLWEGDAGRKNLRLMIEGMTGNSSSWKRLSASAEEAMLDDIESAQRLDQAMDNVICLDTSGSMAGAALEELKRLTHKFIEEIESIAAKYGIAENIALVTFGGRAKVIHHLSNDYERLKKSLDSLTARGPGPILEAAIVAVSCLSKGRSRSLTTKQ